MVFVRLHLLRGRWGQRYSRHIRYHSLLRGHQPRPEHYPRRKPNNRKHPLFAPTATLAARLRWDSPRAPPRLRIVLPSRRRTTVTMYYNVNSSPHSSLLEEKLLVAEPRHFDTSLNRLLVVRCLGNGNRVPIVLMIRLPKVRPLY